MRPSTAAPRASTKHRGSRRLGDDDVVVAASSFTSLWAMGWIGAETLAVSTAMQGGFAVGGVMASSGLALLWWKTRTLRELQHPADEAEAKRAEDEGTPL